MIFWKTKIKRHHISTCIYNIWRSGNKKHFFVRQRCCGKTDLFLMFRWILKSIVRSSYKIQFKTQQKRRVLLTSKCCEILIVKSVFPLQSWSFHRQEEWNDFVIILSHIDPQGLKAAPMCLCKYSSLPDHFWWCIIIHRTSWSRIQTAQGINGDLIERHLDEFTRSENTCKQWFTLITCSKGT